MAAVKHDFKVGQVVTAINKNKGYYGAKGYSIGGLATIVGLLNEDNWYKVRYFDEEHKINRPVRKLFVDPDSQADPNAWIEANS